MGLGTIGLCQDTGRVNGFQIQLVGTVQYTEEVGYGTSTDSTYPRITARGSRSFVQQYRMKTD